MIVYTNLSECTITYFRKLYLNHNLKLYSGNADIKAIKKMKLIFHSATAVSPLVIKQYSGSVILGNILLKMIQSLIQLVATFLVP